MSQKPKSRQALREILVSCSDTLFPAELGMAPVEVKSRGANGDTPLHVMLWQENTYGALQLIEAGADVNAAGDMSETPLHLAVKKQNIPVVEALLKAGADASCVSEFGHSPQEVANQLSSDLRRLFASR